MVHGPDSAPRASLFSPRCCPWVWSGPTHTACDVCQTNFTHRAWDLYTCGSGPSGWIWTHTTCNTCPGPSRMHATCGAHCWSRTCAMCCVGPRSASCGCCRQCASYASPTQVPRVAQSQTSQSKHQIHWIQHEVWGLQSVSCSTEK